MGIDEYANYEVNEQYTNNTNVDEHDYSMISTLSAVFCFEQDVDNVGLRSFMFYNWRYENMIFIHYILAFQ